MFASKFVFFAALMAVFTAVIAVPPGCLIGAIKYVVKAKPPEYSPQEKEEGARRKRP